MKSNKKTCDILHDRVKLSKDTCTNYDGNVKIINMDIKSSTKGILFIKDRIREMELEKSGIVY